MTWRRERRRPLHEPTRPATEIDGASRHAAPAVIRVGTTYGRVLVAIGGQNWADMPPAVARQVARELHRSARRVEAERAYLIDVARALVEQAGSPA